MANSSDRHALKKPGTIWKSRVRLTRWAKWAVCLLGAKVLVSILYEYRWYFPPDFEQSAFLIGRKASFAGVYKLAFYSHIVSGPLALVLAVFLMGSGARPGLNKWHRWCGRGQMVLIGVLTVSGFIMARWAFAGTVGGVGFMCLAIVTATTATMAAYHAAGGRIHVHRIWATRCLLLLASPLLLRVASGLMIVTHMESQWTYWMNAWCSWLIPLCVYEFWAKSVLLRSTTRHLVEVVP